MTARPLIVFDVNETLLDLQTMEPIFERIFGEKTAMRLWFANLIMYSAALTVAGRYVPFTDYPQADYIRVSVAAAQKLHPTRSLREALRRLGRLRGKRGARNGGRGSGG